MWRVSGEQGPSGPDGQEQEPYRSARRRPQKGLFGLLCLFILHSLEFPDLKLLIVVTFCLVAE